MFKPHLQILPDAQQRLWPELRPSVRLGFVLYGGTAVALRFGHRASVDFDFFSHEPLKRKSLEASFGFLSAATVIQGAARALFGSAFQPSECLKALAYFEDGDLPELTEEDRRTLVSAVRSVRELPDIRTVSRELT